MKYLILRRLFAYNKKWLDSYVFYKEAGDYVIVRHSVPNKEIRVWLEINAVDIQFNPSEETDNGDGEAPLESCKLAELK